MWKAELHTVLTIRQRCIAALCGACYGFFGLVRVWGFGCFSATAPGPHEFKVTTVTPRFLFWIQEFSTSVLGSTTCRQGLDYFSYLHKTCDTKSVTNLKISLFIPFSSSSMKVLNETGPRTNSWGTLLPTLLHPEKCSLILLFPSHPLSNFQSIQMPLLQSYCNLLSFIN